MDISVLYHLQTPLDAIKGSTAITLGRTPTPDPAETRRLFHSIDRQADLLNHLVENMIYQAETEADEQGSDGEPEPFVLEELTINYAERRVTVAGCPVRLTTTEYRPLQELSNNAGRVLTQERLLRRVWGPATRTTRSSCTPSSTASPASSGTTPGVPPTFSPSPGWGTGWPRRRRSADARQVEVAHGVVHAVGRSVGLGEDGAQMLGEPRLDAGVEDGHGAPSPLCSIVLMISSFDEEKTNCSECSKVVEFMRSIISSLICEELGNTPLSSRASPQWPLSNNVSLIGTWKYIQLGYSGLSWSVVDGISDSISFLGLVDSQNSKFLLQGAC